jgi:CO/xanthine dehydrogenase Mo-binding subunit
MSVPEAVGQPVLKYDALDKAMGRACYTDDIDMSRLVYGAILRSPHAFCDVLSIDASEALKIEGVLDVMLPEDVPQRVFNCSGNPPSPLLIPDERVLTRRPLCAGDRIAAVAAVTLDACRQALRAVRVEYDVKRPVLSIKEALMEGAPPVQPQISATNLVHTVRASEGDADKGLGESDFVMEGRFETPAVQHVALEPTACVCDFSDGEFLTVWSSSQTIFQERRILSELFDMPESKIRFIKPAVGGGFGARQQLHNQHVAALLSRRVRRPVKIVNTREEEMYASVTRHEAETHIKMGFMKDGTIKACRVETWFNTGPYVTHGPTVVAASSRKLQYAAEHYLFEGHTVYTNSPTAGAMRGYGNPQIVYGRELLINRAARRLGVDPIEFRLQNHVKTGGHFPAASYSVTSCAIEECVRKANAAREAIDERHKKHKKNKKSAWGVAFCCHTSGPSSKEGMSSAVVMAADDGSVQLLIGSCDIGQGSETVMAQIAAQELGISTDRVRVTAADTASTPYDTGTFASSQTYVCGNAVFRAARDLVEKVRLGLAELHGVEAEVVSSGRGRFRVETPDKKSGGKFSIEFSFAEAITALSFGMKGRVVIGDGYYKALASPPPFAVCMARLEQNLETGAICLTDVIEAVDVGQAINPRLVEAQIEGGVLQGLGYALYETVQRDAPHRKPCASDLLHYRIATSVDAPAIHPIVVSGYEPSGPFGAKSVGELTLVPVAPAIADALEILTAKEYNRIPVSLQGVIISARDE